MPMHTFTQDLLYIPYSSIHGLQVTFACCAGKKLDPAKCQDVDETLRSADPGNA